MQAPALEAELAARVPQYPNQRNATIGRRFFTRQKLSPPADSRARWHDLEDLYR